MTAHLCVGLMLALGVHASDHRSGFTVPGHPQPVYDYDGEEPLAMQQLGHEQARLYRIEQVKYRILELLGRLPEQWNATQSRNARSISRILSERFGIEVEDAEEMDALHSGSNRKLDTRELTHATIQRIIRFMDEVPEQKRTMIHQAGIYFQMPRHVLGPNLEDAELAVYARCPRCTTAASAVTVLLFDAQLGRPRTLISSRRKSVNRQGTWLYFNVTELVRSWALNTSNNFGVLPVVERGRGKRSVVLDKMVAAVPNAEVRVPILNMKLRNTYVSRKKRDSPRAECSGLSRDGQCCSQPLVVDFDELGPAFNFIISPRKYLANYCKGQCPPAYKPMFIGQEFSQASSRVSPPPQCCAPRKMEELRITYMGDDGAVLQSALQGMTVRSCGCA